MKDKKDNVDVLLSKALHRSETPDPALVQKVKNKLNKEDPVLKKSTLKYSFSTVTAVIAAFVFITATAFAAWYFLKPSEVADRFGEYALSAAFESDTAININASATSGDYTYTLLALVTGKDITDMPYYSESVQDERTYAVVAIQKTDGSPMPAVSDSEFGDPPFFTSPLVKGLTPWQVNATTMNGGYMEDVVDGIHYRIVECDGVSMFADRSLYFAISTDTFYNINAFIYDEQTGVVTANPDYEGSSVVFDLPMDEALADPVKAEQYLDNLDTYWDGDDSGTGDGNSATGTEDSAEIYNDADWEKAVPVDSTIKELTVDADGYINYSYDFKDGSGSSTIRYEEYFEDTNTPQSKIISVVTAGEADASDDAMYAIRFSIDENGTITGMIVIPD